MTEAIIRMRAGARCWLRHYVRGSVRCGCTVKHDSQKADVRQWVLVAKKVKRTFMLHDNFLLLKRCKSRKVKQSGSFNDNFGIDKTKKCMSDLVHWVGVNKDFQHYVKTCVSCQLDNFKNSSQPIIPNGPNDSAVMDLFGPIPKASFGNAYILVIMDTFSKRCVCNR